MKQIPCSAETVASAQNAAFGVPCWLQTFTVLRSGGWPSHLILFDGTLLGTAEKFDVEKHPAQRLDLVRRLRLHNPGTLGSEHLLLGLRFQDSVAEGPPENADTSPDSGLRAMAGA